jgi:uncharacterized protein YhfF
VSVEVDRAAAQLMWREYRDVHPELPPEELTAVECFGDSPELADELIAFVLDGPKRATAGLVAEFVAEGEPLPRIGGHWVVCDGSGAPRAVLRSRELRIGPLVSVDEQFAWDEGEYERTRDSWLRDHRTVFGRACERLGVEFGDDIDVVFERFDVVWPSDLAD